LNILNIFYSTNRIVNDRNVNIRLSYITVHCAVTRSSCSFYRAMHFSAKRGNAIACRLSVRLSFCDVGEL